MGAPSSDLVLSRQRSYQEHAQAVLRLAKTFFKDQAQAEDLTHDVFERLWRNNQFEEDKGSLRSYLLLMTRSMALNRLKQGKNRQSILERWRTEFRVEAPSSEPELQAAERSARLQVCLAKLKTSQRSIIEQCYLRGKTQQQPFQRQQSASDVSADVAVPFGYGLAPPNGLPCQGSIPLLATLAVPGATANRRPVAQRQQRARPGFAPATPALQR